MSNPSTRQGPFQGQDKGPSQGQQQQAAPRDPRRRRPRTTAAGPGRQDLAGEASRAPPPPRDVTTDVSAAARVAYASTSRSAAPVTRQAPPARVELAGGPRRSRSPSTSRARVAAPTRSAHSRTRQVETSVSRELVVVATKDIRAAAPARAQPAARAPPALAAEPAARAAAARSMPTLEPLDDDHCPLLELDDDLDECRRKISEYGQRLSAEKKAKENQTTAMEIQTLQAARRPRYSPEAATDAESKRQRVGPSETVATDTEDDMASYDDLQSSRPDTPSKTSYADQARKTPSPHPTAPPPAGRTQPPPTAAHTRKQRYPPLIVENLPNWATHFKAIKDHLGRAPNARPFGKGVKFSPTDGQEYRHIQRYITSLEKTEKISWFSYSLPADRNLKVAIRGLPADTDPESIMEDLRGQGFDPEFVRPIRARKGRPGCIFLGFFRRTASTIPDIYRVDEILCMPGVKIEAWRGKKGPSQCFRCQGFRHSSQNCHRQQACVRCGHPHSAFECPRPLAEPATCANCSGPHPANHVLCPVFRRETRNRRAGTIATSRTPAAAKKPSAAAPQGSNIRTPANEPRARGSAARRRRPRGRRGERPGPKPQDQRHHRDQKKAPSAKSSDGKKRDKDAVLVAIEVLQEVLQAVRDGRDPTPIVLRGLAGIISSAD